jgi:hypothetical protein
MEGLKVVLADEQEQALLSHIYDIGEQALKRLQKEYGLQSQLMNKQQVCKLLNNCAPQTLENYLKAEVPIPVHKLGEQTYLFERDEVLEWVRKH